MNRSPRHHATLATMAMATLLCATATAALAAPVLGAVGPAFYDPPGELVGDHGDLISYRPAALKMGADAPAANTWQVMYQTEDADGNALPVTGTVFEPLAPWKGDGGTRPVVIYAVGTHGLGKSCAASKQFEAGTDYETPNINAALKAGYAVLVTDYVGYTNGGEVRYMAGPSQGRNVLDIFKAASGIPGTGISRASRVAIWGYSQGGQAAAWAAELQPSYTPSMPLVGVAHGGTPASLIDTALYLNGRNGSAFLLSSVMGLYVEYPTLIPWTLAVTAEGNQKLDRLRDECIFEAVFEYQNKNISEYTQPNFTLEKMLSLKSVKQAMQNQTLGTHPVSVPLYQVHGQADEFIPLPQAFALKQAYCAKGSKVVFELYPSEHIATLFQAAPNVLNWLGDRFAGKPAPDTCGNNSAPASTANDTSGNLKVSLNKWKLASTVHMKALGQDIVLPDTSTFTGLTDLNAKSMVGTVVIPKFVAPINLIGVPMPTSLKITTVGNTMGHVELDGKGILHINATQQIGISVTSLLGTPIGVCRTTSPVNFALNFDGPIAAMGQQIIFKGTTTFPPMTGCLMSSILTALMSGPGQTFTFTLSAPAPVLN